jgi:hypothetical protein
LVDLLLKGITDEKWLCWNDIMAKVLFKETFRADERFLGGTKELNQLALVDWACAITKRA